MPLTLTHKKIKIVQHFQHLDYSLRSVQMYNQSGMGGGEGVGLRPPVSLPSLPLPPDLSRLHQEKVLNLKVGTYRIAGQKIIDE